MIDWNLTGQYAALFLIDGITGYFLQSMGCVLAIHAFNKKQITARTLVSMAVVFAAVSFAIRSIPNINFGYHTILIIIVYAILSCTLFKTAIYPTVLAVLLTTVSILFFEALTFAIFTAILGSGKFNKLFINARTIVELIRKALLGIPTNILLITEMLIIYNYFFKKSEEDDLSGKTGERVS
ncbi:MAG: hypothetical protein GX248_09505 [Peptococcaceae bacterium]|nr:hypothetical protein [Bacillota bacterium]NLL52924.1 hypothetical protein [Peptococcaceae bacterium]